MNIQTDHSYTLAWEKIPEELLERANEVQDLIISCAQELNLDFLLRTTKWGEASFISKHGLSIRVAAYKHKKATLGIFFPCSSSLVSHCRNTFSTTFSYDKNRGILFSTGEEWNRKALTHVIIAALRYHKVKNQPGLGMAV